MAALLMVGATACTPTTTTAALPDDLAIGDDGWYGVPFEPTATLPDLVLTDATGSLYDLRAEGDGRPTLLFFGYASCPDICPVHLAVLSQAMDQSNLDTDDVRVVFVSTDPDRDTPEDLGRYLAKFNPGFVGLTGDRETVAGAIRELSLPAPTYSEPDDAGNYVVGHPAAFVAFDGQGHAIRTYPFGTRRSQWVHDLPLIVAEQRP